MRAAVLTDFGQDLAIEELKLAEAGPKDVVFRAKASGVCHSDLAAASGKYPVELPMILGHEVAGVVEYIGDDVTNVAVGDRVIASLGTCSECWWCLHDQPQLCEGIGFAGNPTGVRDDGTLLKPFGGIGAFAELLKVDRRQVVKIESDLPDQQLALIGCGVTTGVGAVINTAKIEPGSSVAVVGCGGVGQAVIQGARISGAVQIIAVDPTAMKRVVAKSFGATHAIDPADGDSAAQVRALTGGRGVDYAFEVVGSAATIIEAFHATRNGGTTIVVGSVDETIPLPGLAFRNGEKRLIAARVGSSFFRRDYQRYADLAACGSLDLAAMVSTLIELDEINDAFRAMESGQVIRSVIRF
jgi:S-(hydroxymethyl)glutathione dehydrogenase/alcohol dehydrogenase